MGNPKSAKGAKQGRYSYAEQGAKQGRYSYVEQCLYNYKSNLARLESQLLELELARCSSSVHGQNYDSAIGGYSGVSSPVDRRIERMEQLEHSITELERRTKPITRMIADLTLPDITPNSSKAGLMPVLNLRYFCGNPWENIADSMRVSKPTVYRLRQELIKRAASYLGD